MKKVILILMWTLLSFSAVSIGQIVNSVAPPQPIIINLPDNPINEDFNVNAVKEQNKIIKQYQTSLLDTVYFSLAGVFTLAILLAGFSWFTNFKWYEKDKENIAQDFQRKANEIIIQFESKLIESQMLFQTELDKKIESFSLRNTQEFEIVRKRLDEDQDLLKQSLDKLKSELIRAESNTKRINKSLAQTNAELRQVEEYTWELKKIPYNILITQTQALRSAVESENEFLIENVLVRMKDAIEKYYIKKNVGMTKKDIDYIINNISTADTFDPIKVNEIKTLMNTILHVDN